MNKQPNDLELEARIHQYEAMIDGTDFGTVTRYLQNPDSPIQFLLHLKDRSLLAPVAAEIHRELNASEALDSQNVHLEILPKLIQDGVLKMSAREDREPQPPHHISARSINPAAYSEVIYLPPVYLVHTPGLFEGEHRQPNKAEPTQSRKERRQQALAELEEILSQKQRSREQGHPQESQKKDFGHSH